MTTRVEINNFRKAIQRFYLESFYVFMEVKNLSQNPIRSLFLFIKVNIVN